MNHVFLLALVCAGFATLVIAGVSAFAPSPRSRQRTVR